MNAGTPSQNQSQKDRSILFRTSPPLWLLMLFAATSPFSLLLFIPALPTIANEMEVGLPTVQWLVTSFLIGVGSMQLLMGPLADSLGRRFILLVSLVCFVAISLFAAVITDVHLMILCRVAQALCAAALSVVSRAAVHDAFSGVEAGKAMSFITLAIQIPGLAAPAIGGVLVYYLNWEALFLFLAVFGTILFVLAYFLLPETKPTSAREQTHVGHVLRDYGRLLTNGQFTANAAIIALCAAAAMTFMTVLPSAFSDLFGKSADVVGYYVSANSLVSITGALVAAQLVVLLGITRLMAIGLIAVVLYLGSYLASLTLFPVTLITLFLALLVVSFAQSIVISMGFAQALKADDELRGTASGLAGAASSIVSAVFAAAGATLYATGLINSLLVVFLCFLISLLVLGAWTLRLQQRSSEKA